MRTRHLKTQVDVLGHGGYREDTGGILGYGDGILRMRYFIPGHTGVSWGYPASQDTEGILGIPDRIPRILYIPGCPLAFSNAPCEHKSIKGLPR